jgi:hypothetical protein
MRFKKTAIASVLAGALITTGAAVMPWSAGAAPEYKCSTVKGTITTTLDGFPAPVTGVVKGSFAGTVTFTNIVMSEDNLGGTGDIHNVITGTITPKKGAPFKIVMDLVSVNWTASGLVGGGILNVDAVPGTTFSAIHVTLGPSDDRALPGGTPPLRTFIYEGQRCKG